MSGRRIRYGGALRGVEFLPRGGTSQGVQLGPLPRLGVLW
jgi:hypothetical protein